MKSLHSFQFSHRPGSRRAPDQGHGMAHHLLIPWAQPEGDGKHQSVPTLVLTRYHHLIHKRAV